MEADRPVRRGGAAPSDRAVVGDGARSDRPAPDPSDLRVAILESLSRQGYTIVRGALVPPERPDKAATRQSHSAALDRRRRLARPGLERHESRLVDWMAAGEDLDPGAIRPVLMPVQRRSVEELVFRWASLHWSIPVSSGYGRRLRLLVVDETNGKLIGLIGLGDPVFALASRDAFIGWDAASRRARLRYVVDAFVLGAVPPYTDLLGGKLVAALATSDEVRAQFSARYAGRVSRIAREAHSQLAAITTLSALGRSSIYNRLRYGERLLFHPAGYTRGSGDLHLADELYDDILAFALEHCAPTAKNELWGSGFRSRREVLKKVFVALGLSTEWLYHGIERQVFVAPVATNFRQFLSGRHKVLRPVRQPALDVAEFWKWRWAVPRAERDGSYRRFNPDSWRLWS